jgi:tetratricopeptide (TPR) repeat protein
MFSAGQMLAPRVVRRRGKMAISMNQVRFACLAAALVLSSFPALAQTRDQNAANCKDGTDDVAIVACTALITGHAETPVGVAIAYNNRANAYIHKGDNDRAIKDLTEALRLRPNYATAFYNRAIAYINKGATQKGIQDYDQALRINPKYVAALNNRGSAYDDLGQYQRAIQDYNTALAIDPNDAIALNDRGISYKNLGQYRPAIADFDRVIVMDPKKPNRWANRCWVRAIIGELQEALADCNQSLALNATFGYAREARGIVYLKLKNADSAIDDFTVAIAADSKDAIAFYGRGLARSMKGYKAESDADLASARGYDSGIAEKFSQYGVKAGESK